MLSLGRISQVCPREHARSQSGYDPEMVRSRVGRHTPIGLAWSSHTEHLSWRDQFDPGGPPAMAEGHQGGAWVPVDVAPDRTRRDCGQYTTSMGRDEAGHERQHTFGTPRLAPSLDTSAELDRGQCRAQLRESTATWPTASVTRAAYVILSLGMLSFEPLSRRVGRGGWYDAPLEPVLGDALTLRAHVGVGRCPRRPPPCGSSDAVDPTFRPASTEGFDGDR